MIKNERINDANEIASRLNAYFTSITENSSTGSSLNTETISQFIDSKVPGHINTVCKLK